MGHRCTPATRLVSTEVSFDGIDTLMGSLAAEDVSTEESDSAVSQEIDEYLLSCTTCSAMNSNNSGLQREQEEEEIYDGIYDV